MSALRSHELALRRELLVLRAALQRESLRSQWRAGTAPLERVAAAVGRSRSWRVPAAVAGVPLLWLLARRRRIGWRLARWALSAWPVLRVARRLMRR